MRNVIIGLVVIVGLAIFMGGVLMVGQETHLFAAKMTYRTNFPDAAGLRVGSPVTIAGVRVGTVTRIVLPTDPESEGIEVFLSVDKSYAGRVRDGTEATLVMLQFVANEKSVDLTPGDPAEPQLGDGAFIPPQIKEEFLEKGRTIASTLEQITKDIAEILGAMRRGEGLLGKAIVDPNFGKQGLETLQKALDGLQTLLARVNRGEGLVGKMVADQQYADEVATDLRRATAGLAAFAERIENGEGLIGELSTGTTGEELVSDVKDLAEALRGVAESLQSGEGLAGVLLRDDELAQRVAGNLDETFANLASITGKIDRGEGTLGLLVNDTSLHDDTELLVNGIRSSKMASWLIRRYQRRGRRAKEREEKGKGEKPEEGRPQAGIIGSEGTYWPPVPGSEPGSEDVPAGDAGTEALP